MWFWEVDSIEYEIFKQYERALVAIGVNFALEEVQDALENCYANLENSFRRTIEYVLWLQENQREIFPNAILIRALQEQWQPIAWRDEYLELPMLQSPGQRWWNAAAKMWGDELRNRLVADVFYDNGQEFIKFTNGKELVVETAWRWEWERVLKYANK
ncbi:MULTISPECIES: hypothetical protein [Calothrix]|uniref:Uncharacterized protein n=2 Tax=Calothrix TaxID=1186 RepID=A0ABR8AJ33_9CYAN|nr:MULTISPECIES: hypothetical protein [Calothrix]MBD2199255.1 hypothetical protein [Calothrix parietina FACHB-288]MBD2227957.1 hypothetical protein [Calothrix anomala FACHB-343]